MKKSFANIRLVFYFVSLCLGLTLVACNLPGAFTDPLVAACALPAFDVTKFDDTNDGICTLEDCSLREAVITANACEGADVINLAEGIYENTLTAESATLGGSGPFEIIDDLTINGNGAEVEGAILVSGSSVNTTLGQMTVDSISNQGVMEVDELATGHIRNEGRFTGSNVEVSEGSGIWSDGTLRITEGAVIRNTLRGELSGGSDPFGLPVVRNSWGGRMVLEDVLIADNTTVGVDEGEDPTAIGLSSQGFLELTRVQIQNNNSPHGYGIGLSVGSFEQSSLLSEVSISGHGTVGMRAGGINIVLVDSEIVDNPGAALVNVELPSMIVRRSTIARNGTHSSYCGTVGNQGGQLRIENSTLSQNVNSIDGCGVVWSNAGEVEIVASTIYGNELAAITNAPEGTPGEVRFQGSIVANNSGGNCVGPTVTTLGFNLFDDSTCSPDETLGDLVDTSGALGLGPLADNGGPNQTHALEESSPALDAAGDRCPSTDQRGIPRPAGSACDIGAYEAGEIVTMSGELPEGIPLGPTNCRFGPRPIYPTINYLSEGQAVQLLSRNEAATWVEVISLEGEVGPCWVDVDLLEIPPTVDLPALDLGFIPPEPTLTPVPESEGSDGGGQEQVGCVVGYTGQSPICAVPCPDPDKYPVTCTN